MLSKKIHDLLTEKGQTHLSEYFSQLDTQKQAELEQQLENFDWSLLEYVKRGEESVKRGSFAPMKALEASDIASRSSEYEKIGLESIKKGEVAAVLLAGGQGSRLGFDGPKGTYDIGKTKEMPIFSVLTETLKTVADKADTWIHFYIMTSEINHDQTVESFEANNYWGYPREYVHFFIQDMEPAVDFEGKLYMSALDRLAYTPNGNGGWFVSMAKYGFLSQMHENGIKWLNVFAVDNVLQKIADPVFVGATIKAGVTCGAKVIRKNSPYEKVGVLCYEDGVPSIVEYCDMSEEMANQLDENGNLAYSYGVILNYLFSVKNLEKTMDKKLPVHLAKKKLSYMAPNGEIVKPTKENGYKFEYFILDMIQYMDSCLPYEVVREKEFAPVKNLTGVDSVESAQKLLEMNGVEL